MSNKHAGGRPRHGAERRRPLGTNVRALLGAVTAPAVIVACTDVARGPDMAAVGPRGPSPTVAFAVAPGGPEPDYIAADVVMTATQPDVGATTGPRQVVRYRVERAGVPTATAADGALQSGTSSAGATGWRTVVTYDAAPPPELGPTRRRIGVGRLEIDPDGTTRVYDRAGTLVAIPKDGEVGRIAASHGVAPAADLLIAPGEPVRDPLTTHPARSRPAKSGGAGGLLGPEMRGEARGHLEQRFGAPVGRVGDLTRYVTRLRGTGAGAPSDARRAGGADDGAADVLEVLFDAGRGLVIEQNVTRAGKLAHHARFTYTDVGGGRYVRTAAHLEFARDGSRRAVVEHVLSNIRVERRGAK